MDNRHSQASQGQILQFMIAEYEALREARSISLTVSSNSSNLFLAAVSGAIIALGLIGEFLTGDTLFLASLVILSGLFLIGLGTFGRTLEGQIMCRIYVRGMNRIRRYFSELTPSVENYLIMPVSDDKPAFCSAGSNPSKCVALFVNLPTMIAMISSIIGSVLIVGIPMVWCARSMHLTILWGVVVFTEMFIAHQIYQMVRFKKAEKETEIRFPSNQTHK